MRPAVVAASTVRQHRETDRPRLIQVRPACSPRIIRAQKALEALLFGLMAGLAIPPPGHRPRHRNHSLNPFQRTGGVASAGEPPPICLHPIRHSSGKPRSAGAAPCHPGSCPRWGAHGPGPWLESCQHPKPCRRQVRRLIPACPCLTWRGGDLTPVADYARCQCQHGCSAGERNFRFAPEASAALVGQATPSQVPIEPPPANAPWMCTHLRLTPLLPPSCSSWGSRPHSQSADLPLEPCWPAM